tara:strand:- start:447 stop:878 length:432 start_codon:yes stop_codon:yes gene_type:complete
MSSVLKLPDVVRKYLTDNQITSKAELDEFCGGTHRKPIYDGILEENPLNKDAWLSSGRMKYESDVRNTLQRWVAKNDPSAKVNNRRGAGARKKKATDLVKMYRSKDLDQHDLFGILALKISKKSLINERIGLALRLGYDILHK